ncbi:cytoplasmic dynein 2 light intermediate chain 1 [Chelonus insularis]|uniref:cytoplasmic dynein 2 light intermediate chain 1 n=1 Tax=Chelonus insularis TaxID=460826 RepID=UPI00158B7378|nr:cytoplasmic dynein 2 light intermediate chain 1 [Chelonus insularis]
MSQRSVIIIGDKGVGKTTLMYKFLEKDEVTKPTLAMDYCFGRKTSKQMTKDLIHVWEIGHLAPSLISAALAGAFSIHPMELTTLIIMINLSTPEKLWYTLEECLTAAKNAITMICDSNTIEALIEKRKKASTAGYAKFIDPFPLNLSIVGGQYDKIKNLELSTKELIGKTLRAISFHLKADLQYYSSKDNTLVRKMRESMSHYGFDSSSIKDSQLDYKNALIIPASSADFSAIEFQNYSLDHPELFFDTIKSIYLDQFAEKEIETNLEAMMNWNSDKNIVVIADPH